MPRAGVVSFLNAQPLWVDLRDDPQFEVVAAPPATLADMMAAGDLDLGLLPVFEALRLPNIEMMPTLGVAARGPVESVGLFTKLVEGDTVEASSVRVDQRSRTSVALARIILDAIEASPQIHVAEVRPELLDHYTEGAVMLIGDDCLRARALYPKWRFLDLADAWNELTELPFVFAVWAARPGVLTAAVQGRLLEALSLGRERIPMLADAAREATGWSVGALTRYLEQTIVHQLDDRCRQGLAEFTRRCVAMGLLPPDAPSRLPR